MARNGHNSRRLLRIQLPPLLDYRDPRLTQTPATIATSLTTDLSASDAYRSPWLGASTSHYENFPVGSLLLPANIRSAIALVYRFARYGDDVADEGQASDAQRLAELARLRQALTPGSPIGHPIVAPLLPVIEQYTLERTWFFDLLTAFEQDVTFGRYADRATLMAYCRLSANPVGRIVLQLCNCLDARTAELSDRICSALQLINFAQDLAIDWRKNRIYLPLDEAQAEQVNEATIAAACEAGSADRALCRLMVRQVDCAQQLLDSGRPLFALVPWRLALELRAIVSGATRLLQRFRVTGFDPIGQRPILRKRDALAIVAGMFR